MRKILGVALVLAWLTAALAAQSTRSWEQTKLEKIEKGTAKGISIHSDGALSLAPAFHQLATLPSTFLWSAASDAQGNLYLAAGSPARVYRVTPKGQVDLIFAAAELQVQALAVAGDGTIYAATSPDGRVYRIVHHRAAGEADSEDRRAYEQVNPAYVSSVYFDPKTKYIWALALNGQGRLYVGTGDHGEIYRVEKNGSGSVFFKSDDAHIRALAFDRAGNLVAGSDGSGLIYRITPAGQGFVLYEASEKEITALALDGQGNIYAAATGEKRHPAPAPGAAVPPPPNGAIKLTPQGIKLVDASAAPNAAPPPVPAVVLGSKIYRIAPDGEPRRIWHSPEALVYALAFDHNGRLVAGTGNKGKIYAIEDNGAFTNLLQAGASQVTGFAQAPNGGLYAACSNLGKVFLMEDSTEREGTYDSDVFDARVFSRWGRAEMRSQGPVELWARSGNVDNPDRNWSPWHKVDLNGGGETGIPPARYAQWRVVLHALPASAAKTDHPDVPRVEGVRLYYLPRNVAPEVNEVTVQTGKPVVAPHPEDGAPAVTPSMQPNHAHKEITVRWAAHDENDDKLIFSIYYRADGDRRWLPLKEGLSERAYSFDPSLIPDGGYTIRVVASDAPSHPAGEALTGWKDSAHFEVDTTPPVISSVKAALTGDRLHISFSASDSFSVIQRAEYSIDAGNWQFAAPIGGISDSRTENYDFSVPLPVQTEGAEAADAMAAVESHSSTAAIGSRQAEHIVVVRVYDQTDNVATAKVTVRGKR